MKRMTPIIAAALMITFTPSVPVRAQTAKDLVGVWEMTANVNTAPDGQRSNPFGNTPKGMSVFTADGHFIQVLMRPDLPKFASGNRLQGTAAENQAIVRGSIAAYGTYAVKDKTLVLHVQGGTWPGWVGTDQTRQLTAEGQDTLVFTLAGSIGGNSVVTWKRVK